jgi:hypothetical protein
MHPSQHMGIDTCNVGLRNASPKLVIRVNEYSAEAISGRTLNSVLRAHIKSDIIKCKYTIEGQLTSHYEAIAYIDRGELVDGIYIYSKGYQLFVDANTKLITNLWNDNND